MKFLSIKLLNASRCVDLHQSRLDFRTAILSNYWPEEDILILLTDFY
ncbi:hypothetical protein V1278_003246 [Bradyrhizobium sp. AZCC 1577]